MPLNKKKMHNPGSDLIWQNSVKLVTEVLRCRSKEQVTSQGETAHTAQVRDPASRDMHRNLQTDEGFAKQSNLRSTPYWKYLQKLEWHFSSPNQVSSGKMIEQERVFQTAQLKREKMFI